MKRWLIIAAAVGGALVLGLAVLVIYPSARGPSECRRTAFQARGVLKTLYVSAMVAVAEEEALPAELEPLIRELPDEQRRTVRETMNEYQLSYRRLGAETFELQVEGTGSLGAYKIGYYAPDDERNGKIVEIARACAE